jgi:hypothetical protein
MLEYPVAWFFCDAKGLEISEGSNEMQHLVIPQASDVRDGSWSLTRNRVTTVPEVPAGTNDKPR